ncbi:hypothetical protein EDC04DRAFT_2898301 [Pisolithus marmoratus]|nr:hypothetical protein EDC04DRAFT_2898301 [Pisolithus marmoratus]
MRLVPPRRCVFRVRRRLHQIAAIQPRSHLHHPPIVHHGSATLEKQLQTLHNITWNIITTAQSAKNTPDAASSHDVCMSDSKETLREADFAALGRIAVRLIPTATIPDDTATASCGGCQHEIVSTFALPPIRSGCGHLRVLDLLETAIVKLQAFMASVDTALPQVHHEPIPASATVVPKMAWLSVVYENDVDAAERSIPLMQKAGLTIPEDAINHILGVSASKGDTSRLESLMHRTLSEGPPTETQRDLHVKAHLVRASQYTPSGHSDLVDSTRPVFPTGALDVLHDYEASGHFAPIKSYTRAISALFNVQTHPSSDPRLGQLAARAHAWDLFAHMRYVAHPTPDAYLYAMMIRACGSAGGHVEPERALDLWTEMQANRIEPTLGAYEAIVLVLGRAGKGWLSEGMRLAREMRERYPKRERNQRRVWCALLEGCKRVGDLNRAWWILAEALRSNIPGEGSNTRTSGVDAKILTHIFHTYASYKPPFSRTATRLLDPASHPNATAPSEADASQAEPPPLPDQLQADSTPTFPPLPPQTPSDVLAEIRARTLDDPLAGRFANIELKPALVNSYLSVFYVHATVERSIEVFRSLFGKSSHSGMLRGGAHTYLDALERCAVAKKEERGVMLSWAREVWTEWETVEARAGSEGYNDVGGWARMVERAHAIMGRVLLLNEDVDGALALLQTFVDRYPPNAVLPFDVGVRSSVTADEGSVTTGRGTLTTASHKSPTLSLFANPPILSTQVMLANPKPTYPSSLLPTLTTTPSHSVPKPLVRLTSAVGPKDDRVPPIVGFSDVELLHHRLVASCRTEDVGYAKWTGLNGRATNIFPTKSERLTCEDGLVTKVLWEEEYVKGHAPDMLCYRAFLDTSTAKIQTQTNHQSGDDFLQTWRATVKSHFSPWKNGVYHRDITLPNLMYRIVDGKIMDVLDDVDLSSIEEGPSGTERTGTVPFMATDLLEDRELEGEIKHVYEHDAESFIWVLTWITLRYDNGMLRTTDRPLDEWLTVDGSYKAGVGHERNFQVANKCIDAPLALRTSRMISREPDQVLDVDAVFETL